MLGGMCLSSSPAYLRGGEQGHKRADAINPRFADAHNQS
jgi:hypothetical protein